MKVVFWIFILILAYLLISYYKGTVQIANVASNFLTRTILFLQGRSADGSVGSYAKGG